MTYTCTAGAIIVRAILALLRTSFLLYQRAETVVGAQAVPVPTFGLKWLNLIIILVSVCNFYLTATLHYPTATLHYSLLLFTLAVFALVILISTVVRSLSLPANL